MNHASPVRLLLIVIATVFLVEATVMAVLSDRHPITSLLAALLDSVLVFPALYFFLLLPLQRYLAERNKAEARLAKSTELLDRLFSITHLMLAYMDPQFNFIRVNRAYAEADEKTPDEFIDRNHFEMFPNSENEAIFRRVVETGEPHFAFAKPFEYALAPGRSVSYWDWSLVPIKDSDGRAEALILSLLNVTERKKAEAALVENEALLRKVLEALPVGVWILNKDGVIVQANPASVEIWGGVRFVGIEDFGQYKGWWLDTGKLIEPLEWSAARAILKGESSSGEEIEIEAFDGERKIIQNSAAPLFKADGTVIGAIVVSRDITQRKQAEQQVQRSNRELAALNAVSTVLSSSLDMSQVLHSLKDSMTAQAKFPAGTIYSYDAAAQQLELQLSWGLNPTPSPGSRLPVESYPFRQALQSRKVLTTEQTNIANRNAGVEVTFPPVCRGRVCIPLVAHGDVQGLMELCDVTRAAEADHELFRYFEAIGQMMGIAIYNARLFAGEQKARQTAEVLRQAGLALTQSLDMAVVMDAMLDVIGRLVPYDCASIILVEDDDHLVVHAARGCDCTERIGCRILIDREDNEPLEQLISGKEAKVFTDLSPELARKLTPCNITTRSWLGVPFVAGEHVIGLCGLGKVHAGFYTPEHMQLAQALAGQAAVAVQNAWLFAQLRDSRERLQTLSHRLVEVQENERGYVARELHDEAGQVLASLMLGLRLLGRHAHEPEAIMSGIDELKGMVDGVLENLHRLAMNLRPASLDHLGLEVALRQHLETIADRNDLTAQMETVGMDLRLPKDIEVALYRIVQEALANVVRHSHATRVDLLLKRDDGKVVAVVEDNGVGFSEEVASNSGRLGLFGMRERAEMLGGHLLVECGRSGGTTVSVEVPCGDSHRHS